MMQNDAQYILIGPGRWGTHDRFTGIPVLWSHICNAKVIIEIGLEEFPLEASLGSHFFHNVTSMNVGYFSIPYRSDDNHLNLSLIENAEIINETTYFKHVRLAQPTEVIMDGKKQQAAILIQN